MGNPLAATVMLVKRDNDAPVSRLDVASLTERLQWILTTNNWSARELARRAGLRSETHVGLILRGRVTEEGVTRDTLLRIAKAANVNIEWLMTGEGPRDIGADQPTSAALRQLAEASGIPPEYVERAERAQHSDGGKRETPLVTLRRAEWLWKVETGQVDPPDTYGDDFGGPKPKGLPNKKR